MTTAESVAAPVRREKKRLVAVDAARGVSLLGMMAVHALWAYDAAGNVTWTYELFAGRSAAAFAVLAGVGIAFMAGRRRVLPDERAGIAASLLMRALLIGLIGLLLGYADPDVTAVILAYYAMLFVLAIPLTFLPTWAVAVTGVVVAVAVPVVSHVVRGGLPDPVLGNPSFHELVSHPADLVVELTLTGMYPALAWVAYICAGLVIGRLRLTSPGVAGRLLAVGVVTAVGATLVSGWVMGPLGGEPQLYDSAQLAGMTAADVTDALTFGTDGTTPTATWWWLLTDAPHTTTPLDLVHTTATAVALLGGLLLLDHLAAAPGLAPLRRVLAPLGAAGSMTLTLYTAHVMFMNSPLDVLGPTAGYVVQVAMALSVALVWKAFVGRGPIEGVVSDLSKAARRAVTPDAPRRTTDAPVTY